MPSGLNCKQEQHTNSASSTNIIHQRANTYHEQRSSVITVNHVPPLELLRVRCRVWSTPITKTVEANTQPSQHETRGFSTKQLLFTVVCLRTTTRTVKTALTNALSPVLRNLAVSLILTNNCISFHLIEQIFLLLVIYLFMLYALFWTYQDVIVCPRTAGEQLNPSLFLNIAVARRKFPFQSVPDIQECSFRSHPRFTLKKSGRCSSVNLKVDLELKHTQYVDVY